MKSASTTTQAPPEAAPETGHEPRGVAVKSELMRTPSNPLYRAPEQHEGSPR